MTLQPRRPANPNARKDYEAAQHAHQAVLRMVITPATVELYQMVQERLEEAWDVLAAEEGLSVVGICL